MTDPVLKRERRQGRLLENRAFLHQAARRTSFRHRRFEKSGHYFFNTPIGRL
jgi:hypothetical protein